jgi:hypothetical protein
MKAGIIWTADLWRRGLVTQLFATCFLYYTLASSKVSKWAGPGRLEHAFQAVLLTIALAVPVQSICAQLVNPGSVGFPSCAFYIVLKT